MQIASRGIELDPRFPELTYVGFSMPTWNISTLTQTAGRLKRGKVTKGKSYFRTLYAINTSALLSIYEAMGKKGKILKDVGRTNTGAVPKFPSDFRNEIEPKPTDGKEYPERSVEVMIEIEKMETQRKINEALNAP